MEEGFRTFFSPPRKMQQRRDIHDGQKSPAAGVAAGLRRNAGAPGPAHFPGGHGPMYPPAGAKFEVLRGQSAPQPLRPRLWAFDPANPGADPNAAADHRTAVTVGLSLREQPLRAKSKILPTSPYTGEALRRGGTGYSKSFWEPPAVHIFSFACVYCPTTADAVRYAPKAPLCKG